MKNKFFKRQICFPPFPNGGSSAIGNEISYSRNHKVCAERERKVFLNMKHYLKLFAAFFRVAVRREMAYRGTYLAGIVGQWVSFAATFASLYILVSSFGVVGDWNGAEVMVLYSIDKLAYALGASFFFNFSSGLSSRIRSGEFDGSLTKPIHPFLHEIFSCGYNIGYVSHISISLAVLVISLSILHYQVTLRGIALLVLLIIGGAMIQGAAFVASSALSFFTIGDNSAIGYLMYDIRDFTHYPIIIYPRGIQFILTFILPFAFMNFYPAAALLGKEIPEGYPAILPYLAPIVGIVVFALSVLLWNWGLKHYKSTGS